MTVLDSQHYRTGANPNFTWAANDSDPYERETQLKGLAVAVHDHDHSSGKGRGIRRVTTSVAPAVQGDVEVTAGLLYRGSASTFTASDDDHTHEGLIVTYHHNWEFNPLAYIAAQGVNQIAFTIPASQWGVNKLLRVTAGGQTVVGTGTLSIAGQVLSLGTVSPNIGGVQVPATANQSFVVTCWLWTGADLATLHAFLYLESGTTASITRGEMYKATLTIDTSVDWTFRYIVTSTSSHTINRVIGEIG